MSSIISDNCAIYFNEKGYTILNQFVEKKKPSKIGLITDSHTTKYCKEYFFSKTKFSNKIFEVCIEPGEKNKNLSTCNLVWQKLSKNNLDRNSLIINLGGGVVTDLGSFAAATFLRGISFINIPTSLLAMVDASIGGKTGINIGVLKNQVGVMAKPNLVIIDETYLKTLPEEQFNSGVAEIIKHGLISSEEHWREIKNQKISINTTGLSNLIYKSVCFKKQIVDQDFNESGLRKVLNFGHTLGHAIESYSLSNKKLKSLLHGEAIAIGMVLESFLSHIYLGLNKNTVDQIKAILKIYFNSVYIDNESAYDIITYLKFDKKNKNEHVNFVLLKNIGEPLFDFQVSENSILDAFEYYLE